MFNCIEHYVHIETYLKSFSLPLNGPTEGIAMVVGGNKSFSRDYIAINDGHPTLMIDKPPPPNPTRLQPNTSICIRSNSRS